jgi:hypothetical protein
MEEIRCPVCSGPMPAQGGRGRPRTYCGDRCRRQAESRRAADRRWAERDPTLGAVDVDVDALNRLMNRMR